MRLGKEQAAGYVEDTEAGALTAEEAPPAQSGGMPLAEATESPVTVS